MSWFQRKEKQTEKQSYSDYFLNDPWMPRIGESVWGDEFDTTPTISESDPIQLASHRKSIANFVEILTNRPIPVIFQGRRTATTGKEVVISGGITYKNFDVAVGLALHEGSHIVLSDFDLLKNLDSHIPSELITLAEAKDRGKYYKKDVKWCLNMLEDFRVDDYIYRKSPGYQGYYNKTYDYYCNTDKINKGLQSDALTSEDWFSFR